MNGPAPTGAHGAAGRSAGRTTPVARQTDISVLGADVRFTDARLDPPFMISGRPLTHLTIAHVHLEVATRDGRISTGTGAGILSVPWSWPSSPLDLDGREGIMRELVEALAALSVRPELHGDPLTLWRPLDEGLEVTLAKAAHTAGAESIPRLAGLLALGAVDNALHDAWSRAAGRSPYEMYTAEFMNQDLGWLMPQLTGVHPGDHLGARRTRLPIQHALGVGDPLSDADVDAGGGLRSLEQWIREEGIAHLKLKLTGEPSEDAQRIVAVHELADRAPDRATVSLDPNEAYSPETLGEMLDRLEGRSPAAASAITYLEQPFARGTRVDPARMQQLTRRFPVLMDEGYSHLDQLAHVGQQGWSGVVIKAAKGQSHAMITLAAARTLGLRVAIQDLTTVGPALEHSLGLAAEIGADWPQVEYNSRQYAAEANAELAARRPGLVVVRDGHVLSERLQVGLYSG